MTLHFYWTSLETQKGPNYWYQQSFLVWCLLRQRNGGLNSGLKSAIIVTDALPLCFTGDTKTDCWSLMKKHTTPDKSVIPMWGEVWLSDRQTHAHTDRRRTKWSLCAAMLRRRHKNYVWVCASTCICEHIILPISSTVIFSVLIKNNMKHAWCK